MHDAFQAKVLYQLITRVKDISKFKKGSYLHEDEGNISLTSREYI